MSFLLAIADKQNRSDSAIGELEAQEALWQLNKLYRKRANPRKGIEGFAIGVANEIEDCMTNTKEAGHLYERNVQPLLQ